MVCFITEVPFVVAIVNKREVTMKTTALAVVSLFRNVEAPLLPKRVWLDPPKAAPMSAPFPLWSNTMKIRKRHTSTWHIIKRVVITPTSLLALKKTLSDEGFPGIR